MYDSWIEVLFSFKKQEKVYFLNQKFSLNTILPEERNGMQFIFLKPSPYTLFKSRGLASNIIPNSRATFVNMMDLICLKSYLV